MNYHPDVSSGWFLSCLLRRLRKIVRYIFSVCIIGGLGRPELERSSVQGKRTYILLSTYYCELMTRVREGIDIICGLSSFVSLCGTSTDAAKLACHSEARLPFRNEVKEGRAKDGVPPLIKKYSKSNKVFRL